MRHQVRNNNFGSSRSQRDSALRNMAEDLLRNEHLTTTKSKAYAVRPFVEKLLAKAEDSDKFRNHLHKKLGRDSIFDKIVNTYTERFKNVESGFVSMYKVGFRKGDGAEMIKLMIKGYEPKVKTKLKKVKETKASKSEETKEETTKKGGIVDKVKNLASTAKDNTKDSQVRSTDDKSKAKSRSGI